MKEATGQYIQIDCGGKYGVEFFRKLALSAIFFVKNHPKGSLDIDFVGRVHRVRVMDALAFLYQMTQNAVPFHSAFFRPVGTALNLGERLSTVDLLSLPDGQEEKYEWLDEAVDTFVKMWTQRLVLTDCNVFQVVAVGGTFDRLHVGHRLLLTMATVEAKKRLIVGVISDALLKKKSNAAMIQPFEERMANAIAVIRAVRPSLTVTEAKLVDAFGPAATDPEVDMLMASQETYPAHGMLCITRKERGLPFCGICVIPMITPFGLKCTSSPKNKISSSSLRTKELAAQAS